MQRFISHTEPLTLTLTVTLKLTLTFPVTLNPNPELEAEDALLNDDTPLPETLPDGAPGIAPCNDIDL